MVVLPVSMVAMPSTVHRSSSGPDTLVWLIIKLFAVGGRNGGEEGGREEGMEGREEGREGGGEGGRKGEGTNQGEWREGEEKEGKNININI